MTPPPDVAGLLRALPEGTLRGRARGRAYIASKTTFNGGRSIKLVAEELGGSDYISMNLYDLGTGPRLFPCEMPADKVIAFLRDFAPDRP
ncbi:hypothetical protein FIU94_01975 [Sulfitobacter sp. THAF37]|uniref:hypothetical protein n=1 Tax=Sulfitobacter sp. THAF37 TaxID=2587855 RepID=UPI0012A81E57|nr:hypothetical protein [Sulfitobacter sp. THAF37]QFT57579.1 hypothetical protein FIU94_01975 [Sulfitobacter sp. THAF37]